MMRDITFFSSGSSIIHHQVDPTRNVMPMMLSHLSKDLLQNLRFITSSECFWMCLCSQADRCLYPLLNYINI